MNADSVDVLGVRQRRMLPRSRWLALLGLGFAFVLIVPWLQRALWLTPCPGRIAGDCAGELDDLRWTFAIQTGLCIGAIVIGAAISSVGEVGRITGKIASWIGARTNWCISVTVIAAMLLPLAVAYFILDRFPNSGDEDCYLFQAGAFAAFRLWEAPPILGTDLIPFRTYLFESKWVSQSPPAWPMVLSAGMLLGIPSWTVNALLGGASVATLAAFCRRVGNPSAAVVAAALFALTPFYVMNAASYFPHILASLLILSFCLCLLPDGEIPRGHRLVAAGAIVGLLGATRYFDVLPLIPATLLWLTRQRRNAWPRLIGLLAAGLIPVLLLLMLYHYLITGSPFRTAYYVINTPEVSNIFVSLDPLRIFNGVAITAGRLVELALWTSPVLLIVYCCCLVLKFKDRKLAYYDLIFPGFVLAYVIYADFGGNRYGPRFYFDAFPLMMVTIVSALPSVTARLERSTDRAMLPLAPIACVLYLVGIWPLVLTAFQFQVFSRQEPFRLVQQAVTGKAIVIHDTSSGLGMHDWDLVRNPPSMDAAILHARVGTDVGALRKAFPDRSIWRYSRHDPTQPGQLIRVTP
ncbi:glycosyltransferase family 39 protein [Bradyrhizobium sp. AUGA SZCCT0177]|uniref:glycosyltransferase family 39 protein n=1 Tax=Bradyrhizobium sp. AUGA SZCCT0177 TaxID=2807665 RepID=UPI001BAD74C3|nr:glycosyltransferase family 39 protein [Bradyrhizobium sp. AUGA SZCCT0177]MBR1282551.1 glycosyltransferase family 39 protein [Bradyrhizobium sp. AUGA SZCCT0177]